MELPAQLVPKEKAAPLAAFSRADGRLSGSPAGRGRPQSKLSGAGKAYALRHASSQTSTSRSASCASFRAGVWFPSSSTTYMSSKKASLRTIVPRCRPCLNRTCCPSASAMHEWCVFTLQGGNHTNGPGRYHGPAGTHHTSGPVTRPLLTVRGTLPASPARWQRPQRRSPPAPPSQSAPWRRPAVCLAPRRQV